MIPKFRAWNVKKRKMVYLKNRPDSKDVVEFNKDGEWNIICWEEGDKDEGTLASSEDGDILMISTGVKDRYGKDIYEGDIIEDNGWQYGGERLKVEHDNGAFFMFIEIKRGENLGFGDDIECEIIGNIYEDTKLLKKEVGK